MHSQNVLSPWEVQKITDRFYVRDIAQKCLSTLLLRLSMFLMLTFLSLRYFIQNVHRDTTLKKELDIAIKITLEYVLSQRSKKIKMDEKTETSKCYKTSIFLWKNDSSKSLFCHEANLGWVFLSKDWISEVFLQPSRTSLMEHFCKNS